MRRIGFVFWLVLGVVLVAGCSKDKDIPVSGVSLSVSEFTMKVGQDTLLVATVSPNKATDASVIWYSDNPKVASVENGLVSAKSCGKALITVETVEGEFTAFCTVTVIPDRIPVNSISLDRDTIQLVIGKSDTLHVTVLPDDATDKDVTWASSDTRVVTVNQGVLSAVGLGQAVVTAAVADSGMIAECFISVVEPFIQVVHMNAERLPDMLNARADHILFVAGGQLVAAGGHTRGFSRTNTAEYYADGEWHSVTMNYTHDMAFSVILNDGRMMLGGGCSSDMGVGQSSRVEIYDPASHSFSVAASMNYSRTLSHAVELADGDVLVSGNWYAQDKKELFSAADSAFIDKGAGSAQCNSPYVLRSAANDAIVFGSVDNYGDAIALKVDRLSGGSINVDLFNEWTPYGAPVNWRAKDCAIGEYSYLILARNSKNEVGVIKVEAESFSLLETELPIPMACDDKTMQYSGQVFTDGNGTAYLPAYNGSVLAPVYYVLKMDLKASPAKLTLYKTDVLDAYASIWSMTKLPDGRLVACGGIYDSNYTPYSTVWAFSPF
jgi:hypothetical protein